MRRLLSVTCCLLPWLTACRPSPPPAAGQPAGSKPPAAKTAVTPAEPAPAPAAAAEPRVWTKGDAQIPVLMYHDVCATKQVWFDLTTADFARQLDALEAAHANPIPLAALLDHYRDGKPVPERAIVLTFDDGCLGNFTDALPLLVKHHYPATFFVHTGYVGRKTSKMHMTWDQLREAEKSGLIDVQPHTVNHPEHLGRQADNELRAELRQSKEAIEKELGHPARHYAHPYGNGGENVATALDELGYLCGCAEVRAWCQPPVDRFHLARFNPKRLPEVIAHWQQTAPRVWYAGPFKRRHAAGGGAAAGVKVVWDQLPLGGRRLRKGGALVKLSEGEQLSSLGRPLVAASAEQVVFTRFGGWMNPLAAFELNPDPLPLLLPGVEDALLGGRWLLHGGAPLETGGQATRVVGVTTDGALCTWGASQPTPGAKLAEQARALGLAEAVTLP